MQKILLGRRFLFFIFTILTIFALTASVVFASPSVSSLKAKKQEIIRQLDNLDAELDEAVENYNEAVWKLNLTKKKARKLNAEISATEKQIAVLEGKIARRARALYMMKTSPLIESMVESQSLTEIIAGMRMINTIFGTEVNLNRDYKEKKAKLESDRKELAEVLKEQKRLVSVAAAKKRSIEAKIREKERLLASIDAKLKEAIARERESRRIAYVPQVNQAHGRNYTSRGEDRDYPSDSSIGRRAVSIAYSLLGRPYRWGASGPGAFDCSGLTMYIYAQLGIYLPHSSSAQYYSGRRVSFDELAPGDLVFFARRSGRISHVGIYVGGGMMIHAPQTGDVVKLVPLSSHGGYVGAVRPY